MYLLNSGNNGLKNNTRLTRLEIERAMTSLPVRYWWSFMQCCVWLFAEMHSSHAVVVLNYNRKSGVNRPLRFCQFPKNSEMCVCGCVLFIKPWHPHTAHFRVKIRTHTHTFPSFLEIDKTAVAYSLHIYDYLSQIQRETKVFLLI